MEYKHKWNTLDIRIFGDFDGEHMFKHSKFQSINKFQINHVTIRIDNINHVNCSKIKNFSTFLRSFFTEYENIKSLTADVYYLGIHETFKEFFNLADNYKYDGIIYAPNMELFDLGIVMDGMDKDKGVRYYLENLFGTGFLKHIPEINLSPYDFTQYNMYPDKKSFEFLEKVVENIKNIDDVYTKYLYYYKGIEY